MSNKFYSGEFKLEVIHEYKSQENSLKKICKQFKIPLITLYYWIEKFEKDGLNGLVDSNK